MASYNKDPFCVSLWKVLPLRAGSTCVDGLMFVDGRLVILNAPDVRRNLIEEAHIRLGHLGYLKTLSELRHNFFWPQMAKEVDHIIKACSVCQRTKSPATAPTSKMLTPSIPHQP
jgi:hypothetical protein